MGTLIIHRPHRRATQLHHAYHHRYPVLHTTAMATSNTEPPPLRCKASVDKMIEKTDLHAEWPLHIYVFLPPRNCLPTRRPLWTDTLPTNIISQWRDKWKSAPVVNSSLVDDPTIQQPGFYLPGCYWALLNHFQTTKATAHPVKRIGALQQPTNAKRCHISSTAAHSLSWKGAAVIALS